LARSAPESARFGSNKVFISALWRMSQQQPSFPRMELAEFKRLLLEANRQRLLYLSRADLVPVMDPKLVADSETPYLHTSFHFVLLQ
jgi:hypothetical protein